MSLLIEGPAHKLRRWGHLLGRFGTPKGEGWEIDIDDSDRWLLGLLASDGLLVINRGLTPARSAPRKPSKRVTVT